MGVNMLVPFNGTVVDGRIVAAANQWGEALDLFDWCDVFKPQPILPMAEALAFTPDEAPWLVMVLDDSWNEAGEDDGIRYSELFWCVDAMKWPDTNQGKACDWKALLKDANCSHVLFLKVRL